MATSSDAIPQEMRLSETHEYLWTEEDRARVGISHYAAEKLGDVVFIELPEIGLKLEKGETFGTIESVKAASDLYIPVTGEVTAVNTQLNEEPGLVNDDPYGDGWMIEIAVANPAELAALMGPQQYLKFLEETDSA